MLNRTCGELILYSTFPFGANYNKLKAKQSKMQVVGYLYCRFSYHYFNKRDIRFHDIYFYGERYIL